MAYSKFNFSDVQFSDEIMTTEEALKDVSPIEIPKEVLQGKKKMKVSRPEIDKENKKMGVKINYV